MAGERGNSLTRFCMNKHVHMLVDGRNALYRAIYAGINDDKFKESGADYFAIFTRFMYYYYNAFKPKNVHIFWDDKTENLWRTKLLPDYKGTRDNSDISDLLNRQFKLVLDIGKFMGFRQYFRAAQEADDLIYAFCRTTKEPTIIVSSDGDMKQIPYWMDHVDLYNPITKGRSRGVKIEAVPGIDVTIMKSLTGDKSDNIKGYHMVGKVKGKLFTSNLIERNNFLASDKAIILEDGNKKKVSSDTLKLNRQLIDLNLCPDLLDNMMYVEQRRTSKTVYSYKEIVTRLRDNSVKGVIDEADKYIVPFAKLASGES
jgi:5'-3' exonuclease